MNKALLALAFMSSTALAQSTATTDAISVGDTRFVPSSTIAPLIDARTADARLRLFSVERNGDVILGRTAILEFESPLYRGVGCPSYTGCIVLIAGGKPVMMPVYELPPPKSSVEPK